MKEVDENIETITKETSKIWGFITDPELWFNIGQVALKVVLIIILAMIVIRIGKKMAEHIFASQRRGPLRITERREQTLLRLVQNTITYVVYFIAIIMILQVFNIEIAPILAGAGVAGLAIGFGAQSLVKDIISGFFIIFEDQFSVGDYVIISTIEGTVEEIGLRTTKIKSFTGELNVIPNGSITQVTNYSIYNGLAVVDVNIPYENDFKEVERVIERVVQDLPNKYEEIITVPQITGVQMLELSHYVVRIVAETPPVLQWAAARHIRREVKDQMYKAGIDIPSPRLVMYSRNEDPTSQDVLRNREQ